jgi:hypothetical protein
MTEWGVVGVISALAVLFALLIKPIISLTKSITELNGSVRLFQNMFSQNDEEHDRLWKHNDVQDVKIEDHERKLASLGVGRGGSK